MDIPLSNPDKWDWDWDTSKWGKGHLNTGIEAVLSVYISRPPVGRTRTTGHVQKIEVQIQSHELR